MKRAWWKGKIMESILGIKIGLSKSMGKYESNASDIIKKVDAIIVRSQEITNIATLDGESEWCLTLQRKKDIKNDCKTSG